MKKISARFTKINQTLQKLVSRKHYLEFFVATLSIPVLITVIILNINSIRSSNKSDITPTPNLVKEKIYLPLTVTAQITPQLSPSISRSDQQCIPEIGEIEIVSPAENESVTDNPINILIENESGKYCAVVWSHRINNGSWSDYNDKSIAIYNPPQGRITFDLRVKSIVSGDEKFIKRTFSYSGPSQEKEKPDMNSPVIGTGSAT